MTGVKHSWLAGLLQFDRDGDTFVVTAPEGGPGTRLFGGMIAAPSARSRQRNSRGEQRGAQDSGTFGSVSVCASTAPM